jgi:3-oxoacyl-[acyl-carrier protein] reductase
MRVNGRIVLVTGGGSGIGRACAIKFASEGCRVIALDIDEVNARGTAVLSNQITSKSIDVTDADQVQNVFREVRNEYGQIDVLVHSAGATASPAYVWDMDLVDFRRMVDLHLIGSFLCVREALRGMMATNYGRIVLIGSMAGIYGLYGKAHYSSAKAGMSGLVLSIAKELIGSGLTINLIAPGPIATPMSEKSIGDGVWKMGAPEDVANVAFFLAAPSSGHVNGTVIPLDKGESLVKCIDELMALKLGSNSFSDRFNERTLAKED